MLFDYTPHLLLEQKFLLHFCRSKVLKYFIWFFVFMKTSTFIKHPFVSTLVSLI